MTEIAEVGLKAWSAAGTLTADAEWVADIAALELADDGLSLRSPCDDDVDGEGRHIIVGGDVIARFQDSSFGEAVRDFLIHSARQARQPDPRVSAVLSALKPLLADWRAYLASDKNHECAHRHLVRYDDWGAVEDALIALFEEPDGQAFKGVPTHD